MAASAERRLFTIRNLEAFDRQAPDQQAQRYEFEVFVDVAVHGEFRLGPFSLVPWDAEPFSEGVRRSLVLRFSDHLEPNAATSKSSKGGFYHGVSLPAEFCALATVLLRRRVSLGPMLRIDDEALRVALPSQQRHRGLISGELDASVLVSRMELLRRLPDTFHESVILAARMYQEALAIIDDKPDLAYLLLVSCLEVFVAKFVPRTREEDLPAAVREALDKCADPEARRVLLNRLLELDRGISRNFVTFVDSHVAESFWQESPQISEAEGRIARDELPELLRRVYNQRSKTLHEAEPFPPNVLSPAHPDAEIDRRPEIVVGQRKWTQAQFIPYARFFERLVQHVIVQFVERRTGPGLASD
jgi:hypothetical protein